MKSEMNEQELLRRLADLPREITPENDVWPGVLSRIEASGATSGHSRTRRWQPLAMAAGVLIAFAVGLLLGPRWLAPPTDVANGPSLVQSGDPEQRYAGGLSAVLAATELEYQAAFREFIAVGDSRESLSPATVEKIILSWDEMKQSETRLTAALTEFPDNPFLSTRMMELRSRQLQFLQQIAALDHDSRRITI